MILALFDFDGTITKKDTLVDFIQYAVGKPKYYVGLCILSPILIAYILHIIPNFVAKEKLITYFFKTWEINKFQTVADKYALEQLDKIVRTEIMARIKWHQQQKHTVVVVSASINLWLKKWCEKYKLDLIATELEIKDAKLTGKFATKNCYGIEKVKRIQQHYALSAYKFIYAYGDSAGDTEMLNIANKAYYKYLH